MPLYLLGGLKCWRWYALLARNRQSIPWPRAHHARPVRSCSYRAMWCATAGPPGFAAPGRSEYRPAIQVPCLHSSACGAATHRSRTRSHVGIHGSQPRRRIAPTQILLRQHVPDPPTGSLPHHPLPDDVQAKESRPPNEKSAPRLLGKYSSGPVSMSSSAMPPWLQYENIINGILVFTKSLTALPMSSRTQGLGCMPTGSSPSILR